MTDAWWAKPHISREEFQQRLAEELPRLRKVRMTTRVNLIMYGEERELKRTRIESREEERKAKTLERFKNFLQKKMTDGQKSTSQTARSIVYCPTLSSLTEPPVEAVIQKEISHMVQLTLTKVYPDGGLAYGIAGVRGALLIKHQMLNLPEGASAPQTIAVAGVDVDGNETQLFRQPDAEAKAKAEARAAKSAEREAKKAEREVKKAERAAKVTERAAKAQAKAAKAIEIAEKLAAQAAKVAGIQAQVQEIQEQETAAAGAEAAQ